MNRYVSKLVLYLSTFLLLATTALAAPAAGPTGRWKGAIELPGGGQLEIIVVLTLGGDQAWTGTIDIPAQNLRGFALSGVAVEGARVHFEMSGVPGQPTFEGALADSGNAIAGTFQQGPQTLRFSLERTTAEAAPDSPPAPTPPAKPVPGEGAAGEWLGTIDAGPVKLRLALHIEKRSDGRLGARLDSVDQGAKIPVDAVVFEGGKLRLDLKAIGASYEGTLNGDGSAVQGVWSQGGQQRPLTFHRLEKAFAGVNRPQEPKGPFPYESREVTFQSGAGDVRLAGTLLLPQGKGPFPAVAMVTGSGPQDRDESLMGHKPFLVIADALARRGIASLRWDDRGTGASTGDHMGSTVDDFAADARAAVTFLRSRSEVAGSAIGIVGHSEGGLTGPMVAVADSSLAFLVLLAPPGEPLKSLLMRQTRDLYRLQGLDQKLIDRALAAQAEDLELIADPALMVDQIQEKLRASAKIRREQYTDEERARLGVDSDTIEQSIRVSTTPWFRSLIRQDPAVYLRGVKIPVLALFGEKDFQVEPRVNAEAVRAALTAGGNPDHEVRSLPGLNHLFQHAGTGSIEEYSTIEETFAPEALAMIGDWIVARFPRTTTAAKP